MLSKNSLVVNIFFNILKEIIQKKNVFMRALNVYFFVNKNTFCTQTKNCKHCATLKKYKKEKI